MKAMAAPAECFGNFLRGCIMARIGLILIVGLLVSSHGGAGERKSLGRQRRQTQGVGCPKAAHFVSPLPDEVLSSQELATLSLELEPSLEGEILDADSIDVEITAQLVSGGDLILIANGDLRAQSSPGLFEGKWNLNDVPSGDYLLHATISMIQGGEACDLVSDCITTTVNRAPELVDMDLLECQPVVGGTQVTIRARTTDFEGDPVDEFIWNPGDGSDPQFIEGTSGEFPHLYPSDTSQVIVWVTAYDARGGQLIESRTLDVLGCQFVQAPPNNCGCTAITVASTFGDGAVNRSQLYCAADGAALLPGCARDAEAPAGSCPGTQVAVRCRLGPTSPAGLIEANQLGWAFEVSATLDQRSNDPTQCDEGQFTQDTTARQRRGNPVRVNQNGNAQRTPAAGNYQFPGGGNFNVVASTAETPVRIPGFRAAEFGADDYTQPGAQKRDRDGARPPVRHWYDQPRVRFTPADFISMQQQLQFVSFVRGNLGTCP